MNRSVTELAYFGGRPIFGDPLYVGRPNIGDRAKLHKLFDEMLDRKWLTNSGPNVQTLERRIEKLLQVNHCITVVNATAGLELLARALRLDGEIIMPSFTFVATAHAMRWLGLTPIFCDVDSNTHTIDPASVAELVSPRTAAVLGVHVWGRPCETDQLSKLCAEHNVPLIFDAAHAFNCSHHGSMIGGFGIAEVFSFHATKFFNTFEGGAITTNDTDLADRLRLMRNFGFRGYDNVLSLGINAKMHEASAAMGLVGLDSLSRFVACNRANYEHYKLGLAGIPGVTLASYDETETNNYQYVILEIDSEVSGIHRDLLVDLLHAENVLARRYFYPGCHRMPPYFDEDPVATVRLPRTEALTNCVMSMPTGTSVDGPMIFEICEFVRFCVTHSDEILAEVGKR